MKKYFVFAAAAIAALASCSKVETDPTAQTPEIGFQVATYMPSTKATTGVKYENGNFGTYAWLGTQEFMKNTEISLQSGVWKAANATYYWPRTGALDFISYSPFAGTDGTAGTVPAVTSTGIVYSEYTVGTTDIMYSDKVTGCTYENTKDGSAILDNGAANTTDSGFKGVPTLFRHALAQVNFQFITPVKGEKDPAVTFKVKKVELLNVINKGTLTLALSDSKWNLPTSENPVGWVAAAEPTYATVAWTDELTVTNTANTTAETAVKYSTLKNLLVLPQALTNSEAEGAKNQTIKVTTDITTVQNGLTVKQENVELVGVLYSAAVTSWGMSKSITYTVTLALGNEITFDPAVVDWTPVASTATAL